MRAVNAALRRMDWATRLAGGPEQFDGEEFDTVSRRIAQLKLDLKTAEETGQYAPVYGTNEDGTRLSSNFVPATGALAEGDGEE